MLSIPGKRQGGGGGINNWINLSQFSKREKKYWMKSGGGGRGQESYSPPTLASEHWERSLPNPVNLYYHNWFNVTFTQPPINNIWLTLLRYDILCSIFSSVQKALKKLCMLLDEGSGKRSTCEFMLGGDIFFSEVYWKIFLLSKS